MAQSLDDIRKSIENAYDFRSFCKECPQDIHCCKLPDTVILVHDGEFASLVDIGRRHQPPIIPVPSPLDGTQKVARLEPVGAACPMLNPIGECEAQNCKPIGCMLRPLMFTNQKSANKHEVTLLDIMCPAVRSGKLPESLYADAQAVANFVEVGDRQRYGAECKTVYKGRLIDVGAIGYRSAVKAIARCDKIVRKYQAKLPELEARAIDLIATIDSQLFEHSPIVLISSVRWLLAIFLALCIEYTVQTASSLTLGIDRQQAVPLMLDDPLFASLVNMTSDVLKMSTVWAARLVAFVCFAAFLGDMFRFLVPLPWVLTSAVESKDEGRRLVDKYKVPRIMVVKMLSIAALSCVLLLWLSHCPTRITYYFPIMAALQLLDWLWYSPWEWYILKRKEAKADKLIKRIDNIETEAAQALDRKLKFLMPRFTMLRRKKEVPYVEVKETALAMLKQMMKSVSADVNQLKNKLGGYPEMQRNFRESFDNIVKVAMGRNKWIRIAKTDFAVCILGVVAWIFLRNDILGVAHNEGSFLYKTISLLPLLLFGLHCLNILYDFKKNTSTYIGYLTLLYTKRL